MSLHPIKSPRKLIEVALPLDAINVAAAREKSIRHGHPSTLHLWWARRPLAAARAVIFGQLVNDPGYQQGGGFKYGMNKKDAKAKAIELLRSVRIPDPEAMMRKFPYQLSGGMRQRIMIAIAVSCEPELLFADEPTTALDVTVQAQVLELLTELRKESNMAMILVTHDLGVVAGHTDKIAVMYAGDVVEYAPTRQLFANMKMPYTEALLKSIPRLETPTGSRLPVIEGRLPDPTKNEPGCAFASRCQYVTDKCRAEKPPLTDGGNNHFYRCWFPIGGDK